MRRSEDPDLIPKKANVVLNLILIALVIIAVRIWHLSVVEYEEKFEQSKKNQRKTVIEPAKRGTIRDRFNIPLAINKVAYRASVTYAGIRQIPQTKWETDANGKRVKKALRKEYISELSELLGIELGLDPKRIEDLIYSKAALYATIPYVIKDEITEKEYYRLKMLEKDWAGLTAQRYSKREYPKGKSAGDIIGYLGAISREGFEVNMRQQKLLEGYLAQWENGEDPPLPEGFDSPFEVRKRFKDLQEMAYTPQDFVGKAGIERLFEEHLRGFQGRRSYYSDSKGNYLMELPGKKAQVPGKRILLSLSQELQEYCEGLLAQNETIRWARSAGHGKSIHNSKQPWIKGGAIVVLDPKTGEVLTLASYPRMEPNDFIGLKKGKINQWFENEPYLAGLWNEIWPLERERFDPLLGTFFQDEKWIDWKTYLHFLLPDNHPISEWFSKQGTVANAVLVLQAVDAVESASGKPVGDVLKSNHEDDAELLRKTGLDSMLSHVLTPYTKLLFIDCCQLAVNHTAFTNELLKKVGGQQVDTLKSAGSAFMTLQDAVRQITKELFNHTIFAKWRELHEKSFLKEKRDLEKLAKTYPKPYIDYFDEKENELFEKFFNAVRFDLILTLLKGGTSSTSSNPFTSHFQKLHHEIEEGAHAALPWKKSYDAMQSAIKDLSLPLAKQYIATLRSYHDLTRPLKGTYRSLRNGANPPLEKHLAAAFYPKYGYGYGRSHAYRQSSTQGSIFKLVTSWTALTQLNEESLLKNKGLKITNPFDFVDETFKRDGQTFVGINASGKAIPQVYKGGRLPRSASGHIGKVDLLHAIETSSNPYFSLLAGDVLRSPQDLADSAKIFGFGSKTGIELPGEIAGKVPEDLETNRTGLYATAIGQHSLVVTPLQSALFLATLANSGELLKPQIVNALIGVKPDRDEEWFSAGESEEQRLLYALGIDFPLFDSRRSLLQKNLIEKRGKTVRSKVPMPNSLRNFLLEGMRRVVLRTHTESLRALSRLYAEQPEAISDYVDLKHQLIGKTSTSESMERIDYDEEEGVNLYTHVWFGGISFEKDVTPEFEKPELVVVVYLRYGAFGKEAAPVAAQVVQKWRQIKESRKKT